MTPDSNTSSFRAEQCLLETATCTIWRAFQKALDRYVLLIALKPHVTNATNLRTLALNSVHALNNLNTSIFPEVIDIITDETGDYIVLEDANIVGLLSILNGRHLDAEQLTTLALQIADGFADLQANGLVYGAFSPARFFITEDSSVILPDVTTITHGIDFQYTSRCLLPNSKDLIWYSPEQHDSQTKVIDARSDIFSVGLTLYAFATGQIPFGILPPEEIQNAKRHRLIPSPCDINPTFSRPLSMILTKMTQRDPNLRYADWYSVIEDLKLARQGISPTIEHPECSMIAPPSKTTPKKAGKTLRISVSELRAYRAKKQKAKPHLYLWIVAGLLFSLLILALYFFIKAVLQ